MARPTTRPADRSLGAAATVPVLLLLLSVWVVVASTGLGYWTPIGPGPGFFPLWLAILLGTMSVAWLVQRLRARSAPPEAAAEPLQLTQVHLVLGSLIAVTVLLEVLGFQLAMLLFLLFQLRVLARRGWVLAITLSALGSFGVFTVFAQLLTVDLPTSSIPLLRSMGL